MDNDKKLCNAHKVNRHCLLFAIDAKHNMKYKHDNIQDVLKKQY
jgi:hypothetical protein